MPRPRHVLVGLLLVGLFALTIPAAALAGGSAGDQQYVDPLKHKSSKTTTTSSSTTPSPSSSGSGSGSSGSGSSSAPTTSSTLSATPATSSSTPTATTAATTSTSSGKQLPYTGYDDRAAVALGFLLVIGGVVLRRRTRRS